MALPHALEMAKRRMQQAEAEVSKYLEGQCREPELHKTLIQDFKDVSTQFLDLIEQFAPRSLKTPRAPHAEN